MGYYETEITLNRRKKLLVAGRNPQGKTTAENL